MSTAISATLTTVKTNNSFKATNLPPASCRRFFVELQVFTYLLLPFYSPKTQHVASRRTYDIASTRQGQLRGSRRATHAL